MVLENRRLQRRNRLTIRCHRFRMMALSYKWVVIGLLAFAAFFNGATRLVFSYMVPPVQEDLRLSDVQIGALMSIFLWTYAAFSPFAGYLGDRFSRRKVLIASLSGWSLVTCLTGLVTSAAQLFTARALLALTQAFHIPASMAILADFHGRRTRGKAVAALHVLAGLASAPTGALVGWIAERSGWRLPLFVLGGGGLLLALLMRSCLKEIRPGSTEESSDPETISSAPFGQTMRSLVCTPSFICLGLVSGITSLAIWTLITWLPLFLHEHFQTTLAQSGFLGTLAVSVSSMAGIGVGGYLSDRVGAARPSMRLLLFILFLSLAVPWPLVFWWANSVTWVLLATGFFIFFRSSGESNWHPVLYEFVVPQMRSTATGVTNAFNCIMGGVGALVAGYYKESLGLQVVFGMVALVILIASATLVLAYFAFLQRDMKRAQDFLRGA
jgi:predicted MFS family arabinose efflux permease